MVWTKEDYAEAQRRYTKTPNGRIKKREQNRRWRDRHKKHVSDYNRKWRKKHPNYMKEWGKKVRKISIN